MSVHASSPDAPGWYPDPAGLAGSRWWDGTDWTGRRLLPPPHEPDVPLGPRFARLSDLLARLLALNVWVGLGTLLFETWGYRQVDRFLVAPATGRAGTLHRYDAVTQVLGVVSLALFLLTALLWCAWQWRLATSAPDVLRRTPAMHVGSWFIPVAALWLPVQNMTDLWFAYAPHRPTGARLPVRWLARLPLMLPWWACWLLSAVVGGMGLRALLHLQTLDGYLGVAAQGAVASAGTALAALLAWFVVRRLGWRALEYHRELETLPVQERVTTL